MCAMVYFSYRTNRDIKMQSKPNIKNEDGQLKVVTIHGRRTWYAYNSVKFV